MKLENQKQRVANLYHFLGRMIGYNLIAFMIVVFSVSIGTIGYHYFGVTSWLDSFHMACMILTGMGPVVPMTCFSSSAKLFSSFYALYSGIAFLSMTAVFFAPIIHRILHILHVEGDDKDN